MSVAVSGGYPTGEVYTNERLDTNGSLNLAVVLSVACYRGSGGVPV